MKLSKAVARVIALARAIRAYWEAELPKHHPDYPIIHLDEDSGPPPREETALRELLTSLPPDMLYQLLLVMYLGRGDFAATNLAKHLEQLKTSFRKPEWAISQLMGKAPLAEYLTDGLDELKRSGINTDRLFAKVSKSRK